MGDSDSAGGGLPLPAILAIGGLLFLYLFVIQPLINWAKDNPLMFMMMFSGTAMLIGVLAMFFIMAKAQESRGGGGEPGGQVSYHPGSPGAGSLFSAKRHGASPLGYWKPRGIHVFADTGLENEGKRRQVPEKKEEISVDVPEAVAEVINAFRPSDECGSDANYRLELRDWLKKMFPKLHVELHNSPALPGLSVEKVAIELQSHETMKQPTALLEKCPKYAAAYNSLLVVVKEARFSGEKYEKSLSGLEKDFDNIIIVLK